MKVNYNEPLKVVYCFMSRNFSLSVKAQEMLKPLTEEFLDTCRHHPKLIEVVEKLGDSASGQWSDLKVMVLSGSQYFIGYTEDGDEDVIELKDMIDASIYEDEDKSDE
jgi:hypothetical protein